MRFGTGPNLMMSYFSFSLFIRAWSEKSVSSIWAICLPPQGLGYLNIFSWFDRYFDLHISFWKTLFWSTFWSKFTPQLYASTLFWSKFTSRHSREVTPVPPPRLRKIRKRMVVPPSSRVLRSHARLSPPCVPCQVRGGTCGGTAFDSFWFTGLKCTWFRSKVLIEMYFILIKTLKNALFLQPLYFESNFEKCWDIGQSVSCP